MRRTSTAIAALAAALVGAAAQAQSRGERIENLELRMEAVERQLQNQGLLEISRQIESLTAEIRQLRGRLEQLEHQLEQSRRQQRDQYVDLDTRLRAAETAMASGEATGPAGTPEAEYQAAFDLMKEAKYDEAATAFQGFVAQHPDHELAANAQYWLGEAHYVRRNFAEALAAFEGVLSNYPGARKAPDALLKAGYCQVELRRLGPARATLARVVQEYPDSTAAAEARARLEQLGAGGP